MTANKNLVIKAIAARWPKCQSQLAAWQRPFTCARLPNQSMKMTPHSGCRGPHIQMPGSKRIVRWRLQTMNSLKGHLFARTRVEFSFRALVDRAIREQNREERRLAEQRATKHQFWARNSCILDGRNYRFARRLLLFPKAQF